MSRLRTSIFLIGGVVAVALAAGLSLFFGSTPIPPDQVLGALFSPDMANQEHVAILELRGPVRWAASSWGRPSPWPAPSCRA